MSGNFWIAEQLVNSHIDDLRRDAWSLSECNGYSQTRTARIPRFVGELLIRIGHRLAGPDVPVGAQSPALTTHDGGGHLLLP